MPTDAGLIPGHHLIASPTRGGETRDSHQILLLMNGNFVKIRITYPASPGLAETTVRLDRTFALDGQPPSTVERGSR